MTFGKKKVTAIIFLVMFSYPLISFSGLASAYSTVQETNANASYVNTQLINVFLRNVKDDGGAIKAHAFGSGTLYMLPYENQYGAQVVNHWAIENLIALPALFNYFKAQGDSIGSKYAEQIFTVVRSDMFDQNAIQHDDSDGRRNLKDSFDQFMMLDMLSEYYLLGQDDEAYTKAVVFYTNAYKFYKANTTAGYNGYVGGYWNQINLFTKADPQDSQCTAINSLMAATALSKLSRILVEQDLDKKSSILQEAELAIGFVDQYCTKNGTITVDPTQDAYISEITPQVFAIRAYANMYKATGKGSYLVKADALLNNIILKYWDAGRGGLLYNAGGSYDYSPTNYKEGFSNVYFALGCIDLFKATGDYKYFKVATDVMNFMYNTLWFDEGKDNAAYCEWAYRNNTLFAPTLYQTQGQGMNNETRLIRTNMLALWVNSEIILELRPWYEKYMNEVIIGSIVGAAVLMAVILMIRKRRAGSSLPKIVKGLLDED